MAKGSQLSQLKAALNQAGLSRQPQSGKKRKRAVPEERDKEKKAAKLQEIHQKLNPFDVKVTKLKHDVGGRKIIGTSGRPAQSKQAGIEQRKKTLLKEYEEKDHAGGIVDRRFGETDSTMAPEERMLERFTRERQRASKGAVFNLEDEDELTHYGQSLSRLDDFDNVGLGLDEEDEEESGQIDRQTVQKSHFGGFGDDDGDDEGEGEEPARKKTKAEVMAEVIAKSKDHKFQRQAQQEQDENIRHNLDQEFDTIRSLLYAPVASTSGSVKPAEEPDMQYDQLVRELAFDQRAKPKDRTKTEEELALEEKEALEKAERRRIRRMNGEDEESEDEHEARAKRKQKARGGDDLEDDFREEEWSGLGTGLGEEDAIEEDDDDEEVEGEKESQEEDDNDSPGEDEDEVGSLSDSDDSGVAGEDAEVLVKCTQRSRTKSKVPGQELPFTFPCPTTHDEFLDVIEDIEDKDVPTVLQRIRALHHPSLAEDNKFKLQALTSVLIDHILYISSPPVPRFTLLSSLMPHLLALTKAYPIQSAEHFVEKLTLMHKNLRRGLSRGATNPDAKTWPGLPELSFLRVIGQIWPTSDKNHHVVSPARLLMGAYLGLSRIRTLQDLASGLFLCTLFLQYESLSKRFVPEAINMLANSVLHLAPHKFVDKSEVPGYFPCPDFRSEHCPSLTVTPVKIKNLIVNKPDLSSILNDRNVGEQAKVDLLGLSLELLGRFADMYKSSPGFIELYDPIVELVGGIVTKGLPMDLISRVTTLQNTLGRLLNFSRQARRPLMLQSHKPIPIPTYVPKFEHSSSNYLRNRDPDHERNETAKLRNQYKQEKKGAIRELRKDARFLAAVQQKRQKEKDRAYNERMKRVYGSIESERAEQKAMEREKTREKRRSARK
ncbi:Probable nucleolar complex protein [Sparassis crispa]|uniref:Probable nucleolar complex protein n=1 Tax=Sparassis crispa TaxID=139825 RepID=A0A401GCD9_9APHY|nr:Probable nucleolar complex protein [Sparassis crispa]GBE79815.1 Probable nucleolar complex protein [Sparassis crispa]